MKLTTLPHRPNAAVWAHALLQQQDWAVLDTETTGLGDAEIVEIAILDSNGSALLDTLVQPTIPIPAGVTRIHGITDQMVANAPSFAQVYPQLVEAIGRRTLIIYNAPFDCRILQYCCALHQLDPVWGYDVQRQLVTLPAHQPIQCAMRHYSQYCAERSGYRGYPRWQKLPNAGHRARSDCQAVLQILQKMANSLELL